MTDDETIELLRNTCETVYKKILQIRETTNIAAGSTGIAYCNFKKLFLADGDIQTMLALLSKTLSESHSEGRHGNMGALPRDLTTALGSTIIAQDLIKNLIDRGDSITGSPSTKAIWHLRQAVQIISQTRKDIKK